MTEQQVQDYINEFTEQQKKAFAELILFEEARIEETLIKKESLSEVYRYINQLPDLLWEFIKSKQPKD